ncbi:MAG: N-acetylmuramoyl-L-alanine amidase [Oscillospiraceae bacterium]|nr:N-acetylmuramoyl-L-alanine amidase [Oscillospiraceae bacterium]MBQ2998639.1 N-acetylmuramoyl-L-alanine amidase [Oscillospiraceae bacterium]MBQ4118198.1 N-acetylmuramoyl-L-alanine amidase [Oscillospiraceae bacterium]MBQ6700506.1 N-acetylmuramoyl-L-alanine amidase [Oscillospiraceae bacterium]MBQ6802525.1 N-acetylmuramoyl-L-alanine amidase [Oscillospiraceae bacterium]
MKYSVIKAFIVTICAFFIVAAPFLYYPEEPIAAASSGLFSEEKFIILDAGHGGEDGGAIGAGGIVEKDINLSITLKTAKFLRFFGYDVKLTRKTDIMTCDEGLDTQRERKISDIKNRLAMLNDSQCLCFISIHQNIFGGDARGAQVFYSKNEPESKKLAETLQYGISSLLQPENKRVIKEATKDIYLLHHAENPAVLVECGFISNSKEAALLSEDGYQNKMAFAIAFSSVKHLTEKEV